MAMAKWGVIVSVIAVPLLLPKVVGLNFMGVCFRKGMATRAQDHNISF